MTDHATVEPDIDRISATFHVFDPALAEDPFPTLHRLREERPVARSEVFGGYWILSGYAEIREVLAKPQIFSSRIPAIPAPPVDQILNNIPVAIDAPDHTAYRHILGPVFGPQRVNALEEQLRLAARALIEDMLRSPEDMDFLTAFAVPLPALTLLTMLGLPESDLDTLLEYRTVMLTDQFSPDEAVRRRFTEERVPEITAYFAAHIEARRDRDTAPDDALTDIVHARFRGERELTVPEMVKIVALLISAGLDTTTAELAMYMAYFAENQDRWQELIDHPDRIPGAVEELLRHNAIVTLARVVTQDVEVGGTTFREGDQVLLLLASAAFDDSEFADARSVDFERKPNRHMTFGGGPHRCLGSGLARLELRIALQELTAALPRFGLAEGTVPRRDFGLIMNMLELRLRAPAA